MASRWKNQIRPSCTINELIDLLTEPSNGQFVIPMDAYNEVYPGIFIGDACTALSTLTLKALEITHVLNSAQGKDTPEGYSLYVNTRQSYYGGVGIHFKGIRGLDLIGFDMSQYFDEAANFMEDALNENGKVFVHCVQGISRSSTLVLAFLMLRRGMTVQEALKTVRAKREIIPNEGFLQQLCDLNEKLVAERGRNGTKAV